MSTSGSESGELSDESYKVTNEFVTKNKDELKEYNVENLLQYIDGLHHIIQKYKIKLTKCKCKINDTDENKDDNNDNKEEHEPDKFSEQDAQSNSTISSNNISATEAFKFIDEMRQAAVQAQHMQNFIYEPTSGLYYDTKSGYYYNAEYGLYYNGDTGCYYNYNSNKQSFELHSQVSAPPTSDHAKDNESLMHEIINTEVIFDENGVVTDAVKLKEIRSKRIEEKRKKIIVGKGMKYRDTDKSNDSAVNTESKLPRKRSYSDGECSSVDSEFFDNYDKNNCEKSPTSLNKSTQNNEDDDVPTFDIGSHFQEIAKRYPPSLRLIVQETNLKSLLVGSLSVITYKGGSLGREGNHDVIVPDNNVSQNQLKFVYDQEKLLYKCFDLGSHNGTIINGKLLWSPKKESDPIHLFHGSTIQVSQTKFVCHIHKGNSTCGGCEPGLLIQMERDAPVSNYKSAPPELSHKEQLKKLQKKYGLENQRFENNVFAGSYTDRAATRRLTVGSSNSSEKTEMASVDTEISNNNKGFKILSKLGWTKGECLGKSEKNGLLEPIAIESNSGTKGLGCTETGIPYQLNAKEKWKLQLKDTTKKRFKNATCSSK